jgi:hypothetical protein
MRKLVLSVLGLLALFSALRAWTEALPLPGVQLHPGLVEVQDGPSSVNLAFGIAAREPGQPSSWNLLPLRLEYRSGDRTVSLAFNGLSFLVRGGAAVGRPVTVSAPRAGDVISVGGKVTVNAPLAGDVWTLGADVALGPGADVAGNVVALGGKVTASPRSVVRGSVSQVPEIKIPFLGVLGSPFSIQALALARQVLGYFLLGVALFISCFYATPRARSLYDGVARYWRASLVTVVACLVAVPLLAALLVISVIGIFFLPVLVFALGVLGLNGFLLLCARVGGALRKEPAHGGDALFLFTSGMLGLFLVKLPALVGIGLTLLRSSAASRAGEILQIVSLALLIAGMIYGTGVALSHMRSHAAPTAA